MYYGGERNVPGAAGNLMASSPHGKMYEQQPRDYLNQRMPVYPPGYGPQQQTQPQFLQPGAPIQLELPLSMRGLQGPMPMGNAGAIAGINPLNDPRFQIPGTYQPKAGLPAGFQNKFVS